MIELSLDHTEGWSTDGKSLTYSFNPGDVLATAYGQLVKDTDDYRLFDYRIEGLTVSVTELKEGKATRGHSHSDAEVYLFQSDAVVRLGHRTYEVKKGQMLLVKPGQFHRVYTMPNSTARFVCLFAGTRDQKKPVYDEKSMR